MLETKYVIVDGCASVFSAAIGHNEMVKYGKVAEGAGFVRFYPGKNEWDEDVVTAKCYGSSYSLGVESRPEEDSILVTQQICGSF
jgi:hypothetical protein